VAHKTGVFKPYLSGIVKEYHFEIYNRWGQRVFTTDNIDIGWNGYFNGKLCAQDVYVYKAWGKYLNGQTFVKSGDITILQRTKK
jgi:gliding motility-associated-like protein